MTIKNRTFRKAMEAAGLGSVQLERNYGYFYIWSTDPDQALEIAGLYENAILRNSFKDQTIEQWIEDIKDLLGMNSISASEIREGVRKAQEEIDTFGTRDFGVKIRDNSGRYSCPEFTLDVPGQGSLPFEEVETLAKVLEFAVQKVKELNRKFVGKNIVY